MYGLILICSALYVLIRFIALEINVSIRFPTATAFHRDNWHDICLGSVGTHERQWLVVTISINNNFKSGIKNIKGKHFINPELRPD